MCNETHGRQAGQTHDGASWWSWLRAEKGSEAGVGETYALICSAAQELEDVTNDGMVVENAE